MVTSSEQAMTQECATAGHARPATKQALGQPDHFNAELLGTISHELRSPLAAIKGYAATLRRYEHRLSRRERHEFLTSIDLASNRLETIVDRLLTLSQLEMGAIPLAWGDVDIRRLAESSVGLAHEAMVREGDATHSFELDVVDGDGRPWTAPALVRGDARLLGQLLDNLIENAVKYWPDGGTVELTIRMPALAPPPAPPPVREAAGGGPEAKGGQPATQPASRTATRGRIELIVRDKGIGIPADHLGRIFETFHRVDTRLTREAGGLGLGLALCRRIVDLHEGVIWAVSEPGDGSAFHVLLPAAAATADDDAVAGPV